MNGVFVSYRRSDSSGHAGRIHDRLVEFYGDERVFRDLEDIAAGDDFVKTIRDTLAKRDVLLVIIGPSWLDITDDTGKRRLDNPRDIVRLEVAEALRQPKTRVIPVLVNGATMPQAKDLPQPLAPLSTRNAFEVLDTRFADDVTRLIKTIGGQRAGRARKLVIAGGLSLLIAAAAATLLMPILAGQPTIAADINVYRGGGTVNGNERDAFVPVTIPDSSMDVDGDSGPPGLRDFFTVSYGNQRRNSDNTAIDATLPYQDLLLSGGPITGGAGKLWWAWPWLSVQIVNNSDETLYLSGVEIEVNESATNTEPLILIRERIDQSSTFDVVNYGWGAALNPAIEVSVLAGDRCDNDEWEETERTAVDLTNATIGSTTNAATDRRSTRFGVGVLTTIDVSPMVPQSVANQGRAACVFGVLHYDTENETRRTVRFKTRILISGATALASISPSGEYSVYLEAGDSGQVKTLSIDHQVQPGAVEHFLIRISTNKSASFNLSFRIQAVGRDPFLADNVELSILTPTYDPEFRRTPETRR